MKQKFIELRDKYPSLSSAMIFVKLIKGQGYSKGIISKWFTQLVDKSDYDGQDRKALLKWLFEIGLKQQHSGTKVVKNRSGRV